MWAPSADRVAGANLTAFIQAVRRRGIPIADYAALYAWSITHPDQFWAGVGDFTGVFFDTPGEVILVDGDRMPGAKWFRGARLNFARNLLRRTDQTPALIFADERGARRTMTYAELLSQVACLSTALSEAGVRVGDRVAGYLPNLPETVVAMLAAAALGAVWTSCSPDFGLQGVLDRFGQTRPKVLFAADGYTYNGRPIAVMNRLKDLSAALSSLPGHPAEPLTVLIPYLEPRTTAESLPNALLWEHFLARGTGARPQFASLPFDHPLYILYSSGTTGLPKSIVHSAGGTLIQHLKELVLHTDLKPEDRIFYFTTCGWMMWNWLVSALAVGATVILYDGSPFFGAGAEPKPNPGALLDLVDQLGITIFGTSAKYLSALEKAGAVPRRTHHLSTLRTILSTGSPLLPESFDYVYSSIKSDLQLSSISGGTDIISCFALGNPIGPVYRGELQTRGLGMNVQVFNDRGEPVVGQKGELVCTAPFPSMPVGFWNDPDGSRYRSAYFSRFPGVWHHGDWAEINPRTGGMLIYGRSDATLKPRGVRIGTAEIYRQVEKFPEVAESLAVGKQHQGDEIVILFVRLKPGVSFSEDLILRIRSAIRDNVSPHHVPARIIPVPDLPRTINGKIVELAVREVIHGRPVANLDALANPEALEFFRNLADL